ncbi:MAG: hypothetical protein OJF47_004180 [Nitrospira sp.]|nr:MAG: hypothetical protein OJF47_004180 [Nitrospira sp.]
MRYGNLRIEECKKLKATESDARLPSRSGGLGPVHRGE